NDILLFHRIFPTVKTDNRVTMLGHEISTSLTFLYIICIPTFRTFDVWTFIPLYPNNSLTTFRTHSLIFLFSGKLVVRSSHINTPFQYYQVIKRLTRYDLVTSAALP